jgi:hypothetical protein
VAFIRKSIPQKHPYPAAVTSVLPSFLVLTCTKNTLVAAGPSPPLHSFVECTIYKIKNPKNKNLLRE